MAYDFIPLE